MSGDRRVVLDASAVLAWILKEAGWQTIDKLIGVAVLPVSALVETLYRAKEKGHRASPSELHADLTQLGLHIEPLLPLDAPRAAELIAASRALGRDGSLSLGDGLCIATAERLGLVLTGGDQHWERLELSVRYQPFR